jgi:hypothetical protein
MNEGCSEKEIPNYAVPSVLSDEHRIAKYFDDMNSRRE